MVQPIRRIAFTTPPEERKRLVGEALDHERHEIARKARNAKGDFVPFADYAISWSKLSPWPLAGRTPDDGA